jgi:anthranilate/para-aminobenzoate synthase component I
VDGKASGTARFLDGDRVLRLADPAERVETGPEGLAATLDRVAATPGWWAGWVAYDGRARLTRYLEATRDPLPVPAAGPPPAAGKVTVSLDRDAYVAAVEAARAAIGRGDIYQVNLCVRFDVEDVRVDAATLWDGLVARLRPGYAGLVDDDDVRVASLSPECFAEVDGGRVVSAPIKGTRPRGATPGEDARLAAELAGSAKERAENVMIVDLVRNDLARVARLGSVRVPELFRVATWPHLHHLVSTVEAELAGGAGLGALFGALFPAGSITGAPKLAAMAEIARLERAGRGVSMGAVGWVRSTGDPAALRARFGVAIRTVELAGGRARFCAGSGIVTDSDPVAEHDELLLKASALLAGLGVGEPPGPPRTG